MRALGLFLLLSLIFDAAFATTLRVPSEYPSIQPAINACAEGDTVLVAPGTYTGEENKNLDFQGTNLVLLSENGPELTILDCEYDGRGLYFHSGEDSTCVVQGFTITHGEGGGAGVRCTQSSPSFQNMILIQNRSWNSGRGGGMSCYESNPHLEQVLFDRNGVWAEQLGSVRGGGLYCRDSSPHLTDVQFLGNTTTIIYEMEWGSDSFGGGMYSQGGHPVLENVLFAWNSAGSVGMGQSGGGGLYVQGQITVTQTTFYGNSGNNGSAISGTGAIVSNSLIGYRSSSAPYSDGTILTCSNIYAYDRGDDSGGISRQAEENGNISVNPLLCDPCFNDFHVSIHSPCLSENNDCAVLMGAFGQDCFGGHVPSFLEASDDRYDCVLLTWEWEGEDQLGFQIRRSGEIVFSGDEPDQDCWFDFDCEIGPHSYAVRAEYPEGLGPSSYDAGFHRGDLIKITSPNGGEVYYNDDYLGIQWTHYEGPDRVNIELSRSGLEGPWERLVSDLLNGGYWHTYISHFPSEDCWLRVADAGAGALADTTDAAFTIGTRLIRVPQDYSSIQEAVFAAGVFDTVLVASGTYFQHDIWIQSGITLVSENGWEETVIDAQQSGRLLYFNQLNETCVVQGFTFRGGLEGQGGAVFCQDSSPVFEDCAFEHSAATEFGGAFYNLNANPVFRRCTFKENTAESRGGAFYCWECPAPELHDCVFQENSTSEYGGAIASHESPLLIDGCLFSNNGAAWDGGGIVCFGSQTPIIVSSTFYANHSSWGWGGAISCYTDEESATIENTLIAFSTDGQAVFCGDGDQAPSLVCCDLFANAAGDWVGAIADQEGTAGNFSADPLFCDVDGGDFRLETDSPCLPANNDCGVQIGAYGDCDETPVLLSFFYVRQEGESVCLNWEIALSDEAVTFRLTGNRDGQEWQVSFAETAPGKYFARDEGPQLAAEGCVTYSLFARESGEMWQLLRSVTLDLEAPNYVTALLTPYPNPFNPQVVIPLTLAEGKRIRLMVFGISGRKIQTLIDGYLEHGLHEIIWDGRNDKGHAQSSGVYLVQMKAAGYRQSRRLILLR